MDSKVVKGGKEKYEGSVTRAEESSSKRACTKLEQERIKKQKIDDDQEEAKIKSIWRLANGSSRRYSSMIRMLQNIDREDLRKHSGSWLKLNMGIQGQRRHMKECYR
ncbi:hypothetical protein Tco_0784991, partial [Tanacetum coccineum]